MKVIDDPESIQICANKIHQYALLDKFRVPHIPTLFLNRDELHHKNISKVFDTLGKPVVIKAPHTSFSRYVEKAACESSFRDISKRFFKKSDVLALQKFLPTAFDWRVGVLNDEVLYVCKYMIPKGRWKHGAKLRGKSAIIWGRTVAMKKNAPQQVKDMALKTCRVVGKGLYGVDIKEVNGEYVVVEVNDNPSVYAGYETDAPRTCTIKSSPIYRSSSSLFSSFRHIFIPSSQFRVGGECSYVERRCQGLRVP